MVTKIITLSLSIIAIFSSAIFASEYEKYYDGASKPQGTYHNSFGGESEKYNPKSFYDTESDKSAPTTDEVFDEESSTDYRTEGKYIGSSVTDRVGSESALKSNILDPMQNQTDMTTLGDTYICDTDNNTYSSIDECNDKCAEGCSQYFFKSGITCQTSKEILTVTPSHLGTNPRFTIIYKESSLTTNNIDAVCQNGYKAGSKSYRWYIEKNQLKVRESIDSNIGLGSCEDVRGKSVLTNPRNFYNKMGDAFSNLLSQEGMIISSPQIITKGSMVSLSISSIVAGACNEGSLSSSLENADLIHSAQDGSKPIDPDIAKDIAKDDPLYNSITDRNSYSLFDCSITFDLLIGDGTISERRSDSCKTVKQGCSILSEEICDYDGKRCEASIKNGIKTNNIIPKYCNKILIEEEVEHNICADGNNTIISGKIYNAQFQAKYFRVKRTYECAEESTSDYNYDGFLDQQVTISDSANISDDGTYTYSYTDEDGNIQSSKSEFDLNDLECQQSCKVKVPAEIATDNESVLLSDGTSTPRVVDPIMWKSCDLIKGTDWSCPLGDGDILIQDCDCIDDFVDAYIQLKTVDEISKNKKCSTK